MEVGAVKQAFNNELILLKKKLNQAKIQVIHKLTRKAKTFVEKKAPEPLKEKLKRKAESAVKEVLIIKKIKTKDIGKFIITHKGQLQEHLNKPQVDQDKACARLLLHKSLQDKYKSIRNKFANVAIDDLFMSRQERRKIKKEARDKQKNKKKGKMNANKATEGDWKIEDIEKVDVNNTLNGEEIVSGDEKDSSVVDDVILNSENENNHSSDSDEDPKIIPSKQISNSDYKSDNDGESSDDEMANGTGEFMKSPVKSENKTKIPNETAIRSESIQRNVKIKQEKSQKHVNKNKNFNEKILLRKFKKDTEDILVQDNKVVDPFFLTSTGENYMSVAEPRQADEVKEEHKQGNRKLRRAVMFGHVPKIKPRQNNYRPDNSNYNRQNGFENRKGKFENSYQNANSRNHNRPEDVHDVKHDFKDRNVPSKRSNVDESKPEKLHPSWEAKKRQSGILPFQGKKIVFDES